VRVHVRIHVGVHVGVWKVPRRHFKQLMARQFFLKIPAGFVNRAALREVIPRGKSVPFMLPKKERR
jgi:hypothetical protein